MSSRVVIASILLTALVGAGAFFFVLAPGGADSGGGAYGGGTTARDGGTSSGGSIDRTSSGGATRSVDGTSGETSTDHLSGARGSDGRVLPRNGGSPRVRTNSSTGVPSGATGGANGSSDPRSADHWGSTATDSGTSGGTRNGVRSGTSSGTRSGSGGSRSSGSGSAGTSGGSEEGNEETTAGPEIVIAGSLVAVDADGQQFAEESGTIDLRIVATGVDLARTATVTDGNWSASVPSGAQVTFIRGLIRDRAVTISPSSPVVASDGARFELVAEWTSETLLHVRSRETGEALCDLRLLRIPDWMRNSRPHPGVPTPNDQQWTAECSPFPLSAEGAHAGQSVPYHVHSPGYAWGRILLDTTTGGDREILLDPGGILDITFEGGWDHENAVLRLRVLGELQPYAEAPITGEVMQVDGILPGSYEVSVETGNWAQNPLVLGSAEVTIAAGVVSPLLLPVASIEDEERVPFGGTVFIPDGWLLDEFQLRIRPIDPGRNVVEETQHIPSIEMAATQIQGGMLFSWEADDVEPGNFGLLVLPIGYGINVAVPETGNLQADISLPAPVLIEVQTVIAGTQEPATPNMIRWTPVREQGVPGTGALSVQPESTGGNVFLFEAPVGGVILSSSDAAYRPASRQITATLDGPNVFTFELQPAHGVSLHLYDLETPVPWDIGWHAHLSPLEGTTGQVVTRGRVGISYRILVSSPGWYTLTLPEIDGFLPVDPMPVEILDGQIIDIDLPLQRVP